ncbi:unnamed protein product [Rotaria socialis]|uniref:RBR-type E3 ubiquitin transferase n=1 Tax=Rotaria socialis TaxID=392032 RepID=A0A820QA93_9BILA|nr:unnamed protein product [Rotaria socialis]CAF4417200.1 unnamed protein product [Rotaria socialis]
MAEQCLSNATETPSISHPMKQPTSIEARHVNTLIRRSLSNKLNILSLTPSTTMTTASTPSTGSLAMTCIELGCVVRSIHRPQSIMNATETITTTPSTDEDHVFMHDVKRLEVLTDANNCALTFDSDNDDNDDDDDDDSFDDEEEAIVADSLNSSLSSTMLNYVPMPCPICLEQASLQTAPCCTFYCCSSCWRSHISASLNDGRIKMLCPSNECNKYLTRDSIVNFLRYDPILYERYHKLYDNANQNPRAKTCPRCSHLYSLDTITPVKLKKHKKIPKQVQCSECSLVWCFRCSAPWHDSLTCKQFMKGDKLLLKWIKQKSEEQRNARKCPKCSSFIQRAGGCPHMTCSSCSCEFCYLCGRRYVKIPIIGQHSNKLSMFGCPYNLHPDRPWLRRTIRGMVATGVIVASPIIVAGAVTAAAVVLPPVGIYKLVKRIRARRSTDILMRSFRDEQNLLNGIHIQQLQNPLLEFDYNDEHISAAARLAILREHYEIRSFAQRNEETINETFPLAIFADMDVENLTSDDDKIPPGFQTCPTTPLLDKRKVRSRSLSNSEPIIHPNINRYHSVSLEH